MEDESPLERTAFVAVSCKTSHRLSPAHLNLASLFIHVGHFFFCLRFHFRHILFSLQAFTRMCACLCALCVVWHSQRPEEDVRPLELEFQESVDSPLWVLGTEPGSSEEQEARLTAKPSLQH